ncbi:Dirigent protein [Dillenia turbinata]|uniref:Dirigent protein n=1 Tax=Dillenia turbinata TaxID=194707 RepID=A0AAN8UM62_9MAGN
MATRAVLVSAFICFATITCVNCDYYSQQDAEELKLEKTTLKFYVHDIHSGNKPSALLVTRPPVKIGQQAVPFGSVFVIDDQLTEGPDPNSRVIGNVQGLYVSSGQDELGLVLYADFGFTTGKFNGSSFSIVSRNPFLDRQREFAVVGGRGKLRLAHGWAEVATIYWNKTNGDAILKYQVTVYHL